MVNKLYFGYTNFGWQVTGNFKLQNLKLIEVNQLNQMYEVTVQATRQLKQQTLHQAFWLIWPM